MACMQILRINGSIKGLLPQCVSEECRDVLGGKAICYDHQGQALQRNISVKKVLSGGETSVKKPLGKVGHNTCDT